MFELQGTDDEPEDYEGFYLQFHDFFALDGHEDGGAVMRYKPTALGYVRTDTCGISQLWDESQIRKLAARLGYDFSGMIVYDPATERPALARLKAQATRLDAEAVIVPSQAHFEGGEIPGSLVQQVDVITVSPEETYARRASISGDSPFTAGSSSQGRVWRGPSDL
ncbi:hypothetical protein ACIP5Y_39690 [Nocardia sp. NPDC088792]|uniref:hypothetical protein n=1 Tax=Nocardia sp. NPDC088792 TaxID=3364332 RepID=UPI00382CC4C0